MFKSDVEAAGNAAKGKVALLENNLLGYVVMAAMAGLFIGIGCIMMGVVGGLFTAGGSYATKLICGLVFSVGLCLVMFAGAELFTGNNFVMTVGGLTGAVSWGSVGKLWVVCWLGNLIGSVVTGVLFTLTGIPASGDIGNFFASTAATKMAGTPMNLFGKAIMCNILVCAAIWCGTRLKSEGAKIAMNFACVTTFVACGFEHSVANMTFFTIGLLNPLGASVSLGGAVYNLVIVTLGNMVGGILFMAVPYYLISRDK